MKRDIQYAVQVLVEKFGRGALGEAINRYRDSIAEGKPQQALAWRSIADAIQSRASLRPVH
jgi:hypothetical protein